VSILLRTSRLAPARYAVRVTGDRMSPLSFELTKVAGRESAIGFPAEGVPIVVEPLSAATGGRAPSRCRNASSRTFPLAEPPRASPCSPPPAPDSPRLRRSKRHSQFAAPSKLHGRRAAFPCRGAESCLVDCNQGSRCAVDYHEAGTCDVACAPGSHCSVDCRGSHQCNHIACQGDARCALQCDEGDTNCTFGSCGGSQTSCGAGVYTCNTACP